MMERRAISYVARIKNPEERAVFVNDVQKLGIEPSIYGETVCIIYRGDKEEKLMVLFTQCYEFSIYSIPSR